MTFRTIYGPPNHRDTHDLRTNTCAETMSEPFKGMQTE